MVAIRRPTRVEWHLAEEIRLRKVVRDKVLLPLAVAIQRDAQADAPHSSRGSHGRPPGYLASQIRVTDGVAMEGPTIRVSTNARTPQGFRYGAYWQRRRPYLRARVSLLKG